MKHRATLLFLCVFLPITNFALGWFGAYEFYKPKYNKVVATPQPTIIEKGKGLDEEKLWNLIQDWRVSQGLKQYNKSDKLCDVAAIRVQDIKTDFSHDKFIERYSKNPYPVFENLGRDIDTEQGMLDAWLASPTHREILEADNKNSCLVTDGLYAVQIFSNY